MCLSLSFFGTNSCSLLLQGTKKIALNKAQHLILSQLAVMSC